jgi:hypothetical protein
MFGTRKKRDGDGDDVVTILGRLQHACQNTTPEQIKAMDKEEFVRSFTGAMAMILIIQRSMLNAKPEVWTDANEHILNLAIASVAGQVAWLVRLRTSGLSQQQRIANLTDDVETLVVVISKTIDGCPEGNEELRRRFREVVREPTAPHLAACATEEERRQVQAKIGERTPEGAPLRLIAKS